MKKENIIRLDVDAVYIECYDWEFSPTGIPPEMVEAAEIDENDDQLHIDEMLEIERLVAECDEYYGDFIEEGEDGPEKSKRVYQRQDIKLRNALESVGRSDLYDDCLLSRDVQLSDTAFMIEKCLHRRNNMVKNDGISRDRLPDHFKFLTILDSMCSVNLDDAMKKIREFHDLVNQKFKGFPSVWVLGAIEVEPINMEAMRALKASKPDGEETRKFDNCLKLIERDVPKNHRGEPVFLLIHFHALISSNSLVALGRWVDHLNKEPRWSYVDRQIVVKPMTKEWRGKPRSLQSNHETLCHYMCKGGMDKVNDYSYMRFKLKLEHGGLTNNQLEVDHIQYEQFIRDNQVLDGTDVFTKNMDWDDALIVFMTKLTHEMMYMMAYGVSKTSKNYGKGHLITISKRSRRKSCQKNQVTETIKYDRKSQESYLFG